MTPSPRNPEVTTRTQDEARAGAEDRAPLSPDAVVISGMSGSLPGCRNLAEFSDKLYRKVNMVKDSEPPRWEYYHPELPSHVGVLPAVNRFDAQFFHSNVTHAHSMDPSLRLLLEHAYMAVFDAGFHTRELAGKRVAVFIGIGVSETDKRCYFSEINQTLTGCSKAHFANRISFFMDLKGPSISFDVACCGGMVALEQGFEAVRSGRCDAAIVGSSKLILHPPSVINLKRQLKMNSDGETKCYDVDADGTSPSEAVNVVFLQKHKDARRIYASIKHVKIGFTAFGSDFEKHYCTYRNPEVMANFLRSFYEEAGVSPNLVEFVEGFGAANPEVDKAELLAFAEVMCKDRESPLKVGSVTSNIGYTETSSATSSIIKLLLAYNTGKVAANLNCKTPRQDVAALKEGSMKINTEHSRLRRTYTAVNCSSMTGLSGHALLQGHYKRKDLSQYISKIPYLVTVSGRTESSVKKILDALKSNPLDAEEIALLHCLHKASMSDHLARGHGVFSSDASGKTVVVQESVDYFNSAKKPLCFVYSGMGSQWTGMGVTLMGLPIFADAIQKCHNTLKPKGINLINILTSDDPTIFNNIMNSFVGITSIQIGLTDVLRAVGLVPDIIIGHSLGEIGCAYADGCLTLEETILASYVRGLVSTEIPSIRGAMAAVGMGYKQIVQICPPAVVVACHNSRDSSTISGPYEDVLSFVKELKARGIFAKEVNTSNIAYHSHYIKSYESASLKCLREIVKTPRVRSERWLSTSVPHKQWDDASALHCSAEYLTNNMQNPVLFEEVLPLLPTDAVLVEIAPYGLLQAIIKRALNSSIYIPLAKKGTDNVVNCLEALGKIYKEGHDIDAAVLYPKVQFPVSTETRPLSHLVELMHDEDWNICTYQGPKRSRRAIYKTVVSTYDNEYKYLNDHVIQGTSSLPFSAALVLVWDTLAMSMSQPLKKMPVRFLDLKLYQQPRFHPRRPLRLSVAVFRGSGYFEVTHEYGNIAKGYIEAAQTVNTFHELDDDCSLELSSDDFYKIMFERGFQYKNAFRSIHSCDLKASRAKLLWTDNWTTLIDGMLQLNAMKSNLTGLIQPQYIKHIIINPKIHSTLYGFGTNNLIDVMSTTSVTSCKSITISHISFKTTLNAVIMRPASQSALDIKKESTSHEKNKTSNNSFTMRIKQIGDLESLHWIEAPEGKDGIRVTVHHAGLNVTDVRRAMNEIPSTGDIRFGMDFSGVTDSGTCVMGLVRDGAASNRLRVRPDMLWPVPEHWTLQDAATVPLAYSMAFYCLGVKSKLKPRQRILVHGGAGALGQAVLRVALALNCEVYATVSDVKKKKLLRCLFPDIPDENIGNSRDDTFITMVLHGSHRRKAIDADSKPGCDIIFNCTKGILKNETLKLARPNGITYDTELLKGNKDYSYHMEHMMSCRSYVTVDLTSILSEGGDAEWKMVRGMMSEGIARGWVVPLSRVTYAARDAPRALRLLARSAHRGRVLLDVTNTIFQDKQFKCHSNSYQLVVCDHSDFTLQLPSKLIDRGAKKLHIISSKSSAYLNYKLNCWRSLGVEIQVSFKNTNDADALEHLLKVYRSLKSVEGIYFIDLMGSCCSKIDTILKYFNTCNELTSAFKRIVVLKSYDGTCNEDFNKEKLYENLPLLTVYLQDLAKCYYTHVSHNVLNWNDALEAIVKSFTEDAEKTRHVVIKPEPQQTLSLTDTVAHILHKKDLRIKYEDDETTLEDMGVETAAATLVSNVLQSNFDVDLNNEQILKLSFAKIKQLESNLENVCVEKTGISAYFTKFHTDQLFATADIVQMPTLTQNADLRFDEWDLNKTYLVCVAGVEADESRLARLCERLKLPALVLQPGIDHVHETVQHTARRLVQIMMDKINIKNDFFLLGYEYGLMVVLEMASILESNGMKGTVFCLGGSPDDVRAEMRRELNTSDAELQHALLEHCSELVGGDAEQLAATLAHHNSWEDKVDACAHLLRAHSSQQFIASAIHTAYGRIQAVLNYECTVKELQSKLVIIGTAQSSCTLSFSAPNVVKEFIDASLFSTPNDLRCSSIVNNNLGQNILDSYKKSNLCESYLVNGCNFLDALKTVV